MVSICAQRWGVESSTTPLCRVFKRIRENVLKKNTHGGLYQSCGDDNVLEIRTANTATYHPLATNTVVISSSDERLWRYNQGSAGDTWTLRLLSGIVNSGLGSPPSWADGGVEAHPYLFAQAQYLTEAL